MTISDSNPIQFWIPPAKTFNEEPVCGLNRQDCFCQPWQCDDQINLQFNDTSSTAYSLLSISSDGLVKRLTGFFQIAVGYWESTIFPREEGLCNSTQQFLIFKDSAFYYVLAPSKWGVGFQNPFTTKTLTVFTVSPMTIGAYDALLPVIMPSGATPQNFTITVTITGSTGIMQFDVGYYNGGVPVQDATIWAVSGNVTNQTHSFSFTPLSSAITQIRILAATIDAGAVGATITIALSIGDLLYVDTALAMAKSDCLNFKETQDCTKLIQYTNSSNFDGLDYSDLSPGRVFYCRFPALMYKSKNPKEQEDLELSNGVVVTLRSSIQQKKVFEHGFIPDYMVLKLQKILMHETITIDGTQWKQRDPYDDKQVDKYNLKTGSVLLTKYNSVEKNTI